MNETMTLGRMIAQLRKEKGLTQLELAQLMGVTDKAVSKWERDLSYPDIATLPHLANVLGVSIDELLRCIPKPAVDDEAVADDKVTKYVALALQSIGMAMGIAVAVSSILGSTDYQSSSVLLGIGLACLGIHSFVKK